MQASEKPPSAFKINSEADSAFLSSLTSCNPDVLFKNTKGSSPIALNLHFQKNLNSDYPHLLTKEISIYGRIFGKRKALKTWFRGTPLQTLSAAEITEVAFLTATQFRMDEGDYSEYGFECAVTDINKSNLALMKGLRFTTLLLNIDATLAPRNMEIFPSLALIKQYKFRETHYRLDAAKTNWNNLHNWLDYLVINQPALIEIIGIAKGKNGSIKLNQISEIMFKYNYILLGDRFFVAKDHSLASLKQQKKLQYTPPWGPAHPSIKDWVGLGVGAIGRISDAFYQNLQRGADYEADIFHGQLPICCSGQYPDKDTRHTWELIEQLICLHKISLTPMDTQRAPSEKNQEILKKACENGWMSKKGADLIIQNQGLNHIQDICTDLQHK
jgi:hypothetical protein